MCIRDRVAAAAQTHREGSIAAQMPQGDAGAGLLSLAQQRDCLLYTSSQMTALSIALVITAVWWLVVTLPLLKKYRQINYVEVEKHAIRQSFVRIGQTRCV